MAEKENKLKAHFRLHGVVHLIWLVVILMAVVVGLASVKLGTDGSVKDILNFAVALSSLLLALVAIVQAIVSNGAMGETIGEVHRAVASISVPAEQVSKAAAVIGSYSKNIDERTEHLQASISEIRELGIGYSSTSPKSINGVFAEEMIDECSVITKLTLYVILVSYERKLALLDLYPDGGDGESFLRNGMRGMVSLLADGGVIVTEVAGQSTESALVTDLGALSWLPKRRSDILIRKAGGSQEALTRVIAEIDEKSGSSQSASEP